MSIITEDLLQDYRDKIEKQTKSKLIVLDVFMLHDYRAINAYANSIAPNLYHQSILKTFLNKYGSMGLTNKNKNKDRIYGTSTMSLSSYEDLSFNSQYPDGIGKQGTFDEFIELLEGVGFGQHCFWKHNSNTEGGATVNASVLLIFEKPIFNEVEKLKIKELMDQIFIVEIMKYTLQEFTNKSKLFMHGSLFHDFKNVMSNHIKKPADILLRKIKDPFLIKIVETMKYEANRFIRDSSILITALDINDFEEVSSSVLFNETKKKAGKVGIKVVYSPSYGAKEKDRNVRIKIPLTQFALGVLERNFIENGLIQFNKTKKYIDEIREEIGLEDEYIGLMHFDWKVEDRKVIISFTTVGTVIDIDILKIIGYNRVESKHGEGTGNGLLFLNDYLQTQIRALKIEHNEGGAPRYFKPELIEEEIPSVKMSVAFPIYNIKK